MRTEDVLVCARFLQSYRAGDRPNQVHLVCTPLAQDDGTFRPLNRILQSLKRQGAFCQAESYGRFARDENELERIVWYVIDNPVKTGLVSAWESWPWTYSKTWNGLAIRPTRNRL